ncbi:MAG: hypothetical protein AB7G23_20270 [Vicinamibacterales bacterium]
MKAAWLTVDVTSDGDGGTSSGLRQRVSDATRISILGNGIRIRVEGKRVDPAYGRSLAYYLNGLGKRWRHPLFGDRDRWYQQKGQEVFFKTLTEYEQAWRDGIEKAMDDTARQIEG